MPRRGDRARGVQQDRVARAAVLAGEDGPDPLGVPRGSPTEEVVGRAPLDSEVARVDRPLPHRPVDDLADEVRPGRRELVDPVRAVDDERAPRAELRQHLRDRAHELRREHAHHLCPRAGRVRQRAEDVEDSPRRELAPHRRRVLHRRVVRRREEEAEAELVDRARDPLRRQLELEAERLEHVRRAGG